MRFFALIFIFLFANAASYTQKELPDTIKTLLKRASLTFEVPKGYEVADPIPNGQMNWEFGYKHAKKSFEVRYAIRPLDVHLEEYEKKEAEKDNPIEINIHPNNWHKAAMQSTILNITGGKFPEFNYFPPQAVHKEFNATWGAVTTAVPAGQFAQEYKFCMMICIQKDDHAAAYTFYMADDQGVLLEESKKLFHQLKFK